MDEDEALFASRFQNFEKKQRSHVEEQRGRVRGVATKRVSEAYHI